MCKALRTSGIGLILKKNFNMKNIQFLLNLRTLVSFSGVVTVTLNGRFKCESLEIPVCMELLETLSANKAGKINGERLL